MFLLHIVNFHLGRIPVFGIVGGQAGGILKGGVRKLVPAGLYHHMGAGGSLGVEPPVVAGGKFKGQFIVLEIIFSHIDIVTVGGAVMEGAGGDLYLFPRILSADIAGICLFFLHLYQILLRVCQILEGLDRFQLIQICFCLLNQFGQRFIGSFQLAVFIKIPLGIFLGR